MLPKEEIEALKARGLIINFPYRREDTPPIPIKVPINCPYCNGTGRAELEITK